MPRPLTTMIALLLGGAWATRVEAQHPGGPVAIEDLSCDFCHTCEKPTRERSCLRVCPRTSAAAIAKELSQKRGPDIVILDELQDLYLPVPFDHRGHAQMAEMTEGCAVCHHYTPEGSAHPACKNCHEALPKGKEKTSVEDMRKPSLKAAYHRQCMSCHREWSRGTQCDACHPPRTSPDQKIPTSRDLLGPMHPPIPEPHTEIYTPQSEPAPGAKIIFRHKEHIDRFGLKCAECHREDSCLRCHEKVAKGEERTRTHAEHHKPCSLCHNVENKDACDHCHWKEGQAKPKPFDHADVGWPLSKHHEKLGCRSCHPRAPFVKRDKNCNACHSAWAPDTFDHAVTGQKLDGNHAEITCKDCHADRKFDAPPKCDACHEPDQGITFPSRRPGPVVIPSHGVKERSSGTSDTPEDR
ncbi:MAG: cytochrome c3 family protein [Planctomycetota bacterium]